MSDLDYDAIREKWLQQCGACDGGLPMSCVCPTDDPRPVILDLAQSAEADRAAIKMLHAKYAGRSKWVGYENPRREAWDEIESDLRAALDRKEDQ